MGITFSSILFHRTIISEISGLRNGFSYARNILLTTPNTIFFMQFVFSLGKGGLKRSGFFSTIPKHYFHRFSQFGLVLGFDFDYLKVWCILTDLHRIQSHCHIPPSQKVCHSSDLVCPDHPDYLAWSLSHSLARSWKKDP